MKKILFINDHPNLLTYESMLAYTMAKTLVASGEYQVLMFGLNEQYEAPVSVTVGEYEDRWGIQSIIGESTENNIRLALRIESLSAVYCIGDVSKMLIALSIDNEIRYNVPLILYTSLLASSSYEWIKPYFECVDHVICGNDFTSSVVSNHGVDNSVFYNFVDTGAVGNSHDAKALREKIFGKHKTVLLWNDANSEESSLVTLLEMWSEIVSRDNNFILFVNIDSIDGYVNLYRLINFVGLDAKNVIINGVNGIEVEYENIYAVCDGVIDISKTAGFPKSVYESVLNFKHAITINNSHHEIEKTPPIQFIESNRYLSKQEHSFVYSDIIDRASFISKVLGFKRNACKKKDFEIDLIKEKYIFNDDKFVSMFNNVLDSNSDRSKYISNMVKVEEVTGE